MPDVRGVALLRLRRYGHMREPGAMNRRSVLKLLGIAPVAVAGASAVRAAEPQSDEWIDGVQQPRPWHQHELPVIEEMRADGETFHIPGYKGQFFKLRPDWAVIHHEPNGTIAVGAHAQVGPDGVPIIHWTKLPEPS